jgi:hypothetical protein
MPSQHGNTQRNGGRTVGLPSLIGNGVRCVGNARPQSTRSQARDEHTHTTMIRLSALIRAGFCTHRGCEIQGIVEKTTPVLDSALFCGRGGSRLIRTLGGREDGSATNPAGFAPCLVLDHVLSDAHADHEWPRLFERTGIRARLPSAFVVHMGQQVQLGGRSRSRAARASVSQTHWRVPRCQHVFSHSACARLTCRFIRVGAHDHPTCLLLWQAPDQTVDVPGAVVSGLPRLAACRPRLCGLGGRVRDPADRWEPVPHIRVAEDASVRHRHPWGLIRRAPWLLDGLDGCHHTSRVARLAMMGLQKERKIVLVGGGQRQHLQCEVLAVVT